MVDRPASDALDIPDLREVSRYLRLGGRVAEGVLASRVRELGVAAAATFRPRRVWRRFTLRTGVLLAGTARLELGATLGARLADCACAYLACGTLGADFDAWLRRLAVTSAADALIAQAIGTAAIERWMDMLEAEIGRELSPGERLCPRFSPGYGDFPLAAQRTLLDWLDASRRCGVSLTDSLLMVPAKSVSAVIGVSSNDARA